MNDPYKRKTVPTHKRESFAASIIEEKTTGLKKLRMEAPKYWQHAINKLKAGDKVTIVLEQRKWKRSIAQNNYYWGVYLPLIAKETGEGDLDNLHNLFKGKFLTTGIHEVLGQRVRLTKSTTDLSVGDFCEYILNIQNLTQVEAPPTENYGMAPLKGEVIKL